MNNFEIVLNVDDSRWQAVIPDITAVVDDVKKAVLQEILSEIDFLALDKNFVVNLCLSDDESVHKLNYEFRGFDKPTNVLSFANIDGDDFDDILELEDVVELGDIIIALETMEREAVEQQTSLKNHLCHLWAHGLLHILGYDHIEDDDRIEMEKLEISILNKLGIDNPYQE